ncbi:MAG: DUF3179 domain-containing (seleno)protein [Chitinophagales bacterium]
MRVIKILSIFSFLLFISSLHSCKKEEDTSFPILEPIEIQTNVKVIHDEFEGTKLVVAGSRASNFIVVFERVLEDGTELDFDVVNKRLPVLMQDNEGNEWDIFGLAVEGPRKGEQLTPTNSYIGFWFSWAAFYPEIEIHGQGPSNTTYNPASPTQDWLVPFSEVFSGGPGLDGIPSLQNPERVNIQSLYGVNGNNFLEENDLIIGVRVGDEIRGYPHRVLDWHEIINDDFEDKKLAIIYCPLTGTATAWNRNMNGYTTTFGVSGLLYNSNIMPFDRETLCFWSQMRGDCINGDLIGEQVETYPVFETSFRTWRGLFSNTEIVSIETGYQRDYTEYPYNDYKTSESLIFPIANFDKRLPAKERVLGLDVNGKAKAYRFDDF